MIDEICYHEVLQLEGLQRYLETQDRYNVYTTTKTIAKETKTELLNDLFQKAMRTGSYKDFSALHLRDLKVSIPKEFRSKIKNTIRNFVHRVLKRESNAKENLIEKLEDISKDTFDAVLTMRVPLYKLDQVFAYLQKKAKKENRKLPQFIVDSFIKRSILGPSIDSKLVEDSFVKNIKEAIDTIMNDWALASDQDKEETIKKFELLLGDLLAYTDFFEDIWIEKRKEFSKKLQEFMPKMKAHAYHLIKKSPNNKKVIYGFKNIIRIHHVTKKSIKDRKRNITLAKYGLPIDGGLLEKGECLALLRENGEALRFVPHEKHTREKVLTAIKNDAWAILYAAPQFRKDEEMIATALKSCRRLSIIPLVRAFIPRSNQKTFADDVCAIQFLHIEAFMRTIKGTSRTVMRNEIKQSFDRLMNNLALLGYAILKDIINGIKALLGIPQSLYAAVISITLQDIKQILLGVFTASIQSEF